MNNTDNLHQLNDVPVGKYKCAKWYQLWKRGGWLDVSKDARRDLTVIMWTSGKTDHDPLFCGPATAVEIDKSGAMVGFYESALSMWLKWGYGRGKEQDRQRGLAEARWMLEILTKSK